MLFEINNRLICYFYFSKNNKTFPFLEKILAVASKALVDSHRNVLGTVNAFLDDTIKAIPEHIIFRTNLNAPLIGELTVTARI
jgi:hypothetical protein